MSETTTTVTTSTQPTKSPRNPNRVRVGGLWQKENEFGTYFTGLIDRLSIPKLNGDKYNLVVYPTREKRTQNSPDYGIFVFTENSTNNSVQKTTVKPVQKKVVEPVKKEVVEATVEDQTVTDEEIL